MSLLFKTSTMRYSYYYEELDLPAQVCAECRTQCKHCEEKVVCAECLENLYHGWQDYHCYPLSKWDVGIVHGPENWACESCENIHCFRLYGFEGKMHACRLCEPEAEDIDRQNQEAAARLHEHFFGRRA